MGTKPDLSRQETSTDSASRARDNKRRHRARQKEYVSDLERRVAESREQGVQATKEVQLAAQRVARENVRLRDLLRRTGYTDSAIDSWVREEVDDIHGGERHQLIFEPVSEKSAPKVASSCASQTAAGFEVRHLSPSKTLESGECSARDPLRPVEVAASTCTKVSLSGVQDSARAPCKILTLLAENPAADITQVPFSTQSESNPRDCSSDGVECSAAYKMLMQYATTDEKMDKIAAALESGCTPSTEGGCKVKKSVVWRVLDEECA